MIGVGVELLFYEMLQPCWYSKIGITQKRAEKVRASLLRGSLRETTIDKYLVLLGYKQVRPSFAVDAVYARGTHLLDEHAALLAATSVRDWWCGIFNYNRAACVRSSIVRNAPLSEALVFRILSPLGYKRVRPRVMLPCIYEKPSAISARAYTKSDLLDSIIMDALEYKSVPQGRVGYRALPYQRKA